MPLKMCNYLYVSVLGGQNILEGTSESTAEKSEVNSLLIQQQCLLVMWDE